MCERQLAQVFRTALFILLAATLLSANVALAQPTIWNLRATEVTSNSIKIKWENGQGSVNYLIYVDSSDGERALTGYTTGTSYRIKKLRPNTKYVITVYHDHTELVIRVRTEKEEETEETGEVEEVDEARYLPPPVTCPDLPPAVTVNGHTKFAQCRVVDGGAIGRTDVIEHGIVAAVDVWGFLPTGVEVCFRNAGWTVFLDATYMPRKLMPLLSFDRNGMTCGLIDRAGTVVLLREPMQLSEPIVPADPPPSAPAETSPSPLDNCLIKLVETLFLRAAPGGEIVGLVWLNSEVPVFETNGDWYKIEFEGKTGYISRFYRKVLRGNCD
ncbi:MAG: fibronectin type III domain-containing protein [Chloroflexi bacterium]|nr:fibronectin type III domain-containing protein [Chloroflexota bacterium]